MCAQVAERSLFLWNNEYLVSLVAQQRTAVLPLIFAALERNEKQHWNPQVTPSFSVESLRVFSCALVGNRCESPKTMTALLLLWLLVMR